LPKFEKQSSSNTTKDEHEEAKNKEHIEKRCTKKAPYETAKRKALPYTEKRRK